MPDGHLNVCKACNNAANRKRAAAKMADPAERERERDRLAVWRAAHPDRWKEIRRASNARDRESGTAQRSSEGRNRRTGGRAISVVSLRLLLEKLGRICGICRKPIADDEPVHWDHRVPLARGGAHTEDNLRPSHRSCNAWKGDRLPSEIAGLQPPAPGEVDEWEERRRSRSRALRSEAMRSRMATLTPEQRAARNAKISAANTGRKHPPGHKTGGARVLTQEQIDRRTEAVKAAWAAKTPEEREAWRARCRTIKRGGASG